MGNQPPPSPLATPLAWDLVAPGYAEEVVGHFTLYSADALEMARPQADERVLDVAAGPGTLSLQAAALAREVVAIDFSAKMLAELRARMNARGVENVAVHEGDGQALPFDDASFDAAFSMFGLMFFPDRAKGFSELYRVLRPGGRAVVSSWQPMPGVPFFWAVIEALSAELPNLPLGDGKGPLCDPEVFKQEMSAAGFEVVVEERVHGNQWPNVDVCWASVRKSFAPLVLLEHKMPKADFEQLAANIRRRIGEKFSGAVDVQMAAWLGLGRKPG
ncbi:MAG: methyltransferase domain-containing protein [Polyangiaceae bacterium]|nr:methyltransferase domain-containing protein [Polyangiaceae bacterium]